MSEKGRRPHKLVRAKTGCTSLGMTTKREVLGSLCLLCEAWVVDSLDGRCADSWMCLNRVADRVTPKPVVVAPPKPPPRAPAAPPVEIQPPLRVRVAPSARTKRVEVEDSRRLIGDMSANVTACWYCGDMASTRDHIRARCSTASGTGMGPVVDACVDCNCRILRGQPIHTDAERGRHVASILRRRVIKVGPPKWTADEARRELEGTLRKKVLSHIRKFHVLALRADFATNRWPGAES